MSISEVALRSAILLAVEELNQQGGLLGRQIEPVEADGESNPRVFRDRAEALIAQRKVQAIFGCGTSASRKEVRAVVERHHNVLFYPAQSEGLEHSPNIVYLGASPNQQLIPGVKWCHDRIRRTHPDRPARFFLVGSDQLFSRAANQIIRAQIRLLGSQIVGEAYLSLTDESVAQAVDRIGQTQPDFVLATIEGDRNLDFFQRMRNSGITPDKIPTMCFSLSETELAQMNARELAGNYATRNYFQSHPDTRNRQFVRKFKKYYGTQQVTSDAAQAAYVSVKLWALAVEQAGSADPSAVLRSVRRQSYAAPGGMIYIDGQTRRAWKTVSIGRVLASGQFEIVWDSGRAIRPVAYPPFKTRVAWDRYLETLYQNWGNSWVKPRN